MVRKKWLSPYFSTYLSYIHQTCTNCSSWHDLLISRGGLCPWPTFHAWVTVVRKKWVSPYYSTYLSYIHQTCTNCSSWHDLLIPLDGLCPWPTFHAWVTKTQNGYSGAPVMVPITIMSSLFFNARFTISMLLGCIWRCDEIMEQKADQDQRKQDVRVNPGYPLPHYQRGDHHSGKAGDGETWSRGSYPWPVL